MPTRFALLTLLTLAISACGGDKAAEPTPAAEPKAAEEKAAPTPAPEPAAPTVVTPDAEGVVRMTGDDTMKYNGTRIEVTGTKVKLELKHIGKMPKVAMGHNLVVLTAGSDITAFAQSAAAAVASDYIPEDKSKIIANTKLLGGGESATIEFELPGPGEYPFLCTFPGHSGLMKGVLVAK